MGSGEADVKKTWISNNTGAVSSLPPYLNTTSVSSDGTWYPNTPSFQWTTYPSYPATVYLYQIECPKENCGTMNWLEIDKVKPCIKCRSRLKAVVETVDYEVQIKT